MSFQFAKESVDPAPNTLPTYNVKDLAKGGDKVQIVLDDQTYTLRITRAGKLILTK
jgi:hemin uptake protein HemP